MKTLLSAAQLIRLPNMFTALSNVLAALIIAGADPALIVPLGAASMLLYAAGTTLNDCCDLPTDRRNRLQRPLTRGDIPVQTAWLMGAAFVVLAITAALLVSLRTGIVAALLAACVVGYNMLLKRYLLTGALGMGSCRGLNWLMGLVAVPQGLHYWPIAAAYGVYIVTVTTIARYEKVKPALQRIVVIALSIIPLIDGVILAGFGHYLWALAAGGLIIPVMLLRRYCYMT